MKGKGKGKTPAVFILGTFALYIICHLIDSLVILLHKSRKLGVSHLDLDPALFLEPLAGGQVKFCSMEMFLSKLQHLKLCRH